MNNDPDVLKGKQDFEGKQKGSLLCKVFQRLWPWMDTTLEWVDARTKESWQWDYLLAKELFNDGVLTRCVRWLGSHHRRKPTSCIAQEAAMAHASSHQGGSSWALYPEHEMWQDGLQEMALVHNYLGNSTDLAHADHIPHQGGSCRVVDAACPGLLMITFLSYSKIS